MEEVRSESARSISDICKNVGGLDIRDVCQLADGRMEVTWTPTDMAIHDEFSYLASTVDMPVSRTSGQAKERNDLMHYLFNDENKWYGLRCPKAVWILFMKAKDVPQETIDAFIKYWAISPIKHLIDKELVEAVRGTKPWSM